MVKRDTAAAAGKRPHKDAPRAAPPRSSTRLLIIEARFYEHIADALAEGAIAEIEAQGASYDRVVVPGALEIPQVLASAIAAGLVPSCASSARYCGVIALGCVIRGETSHYDVVVDNANHWLMHAAMGAGVPVGNGILTVDTEAQALERAQGSRAGKGGDAARACFALIDAARRFQEIGA